MDHLDPETAKAIFEASPDTVFVGPQSCTDHLQRLGIAADRFITLNQGEKRTLRGIALHALPTHHMPPGNPEPHAICVHIHIDGVTVYHTGDTIYTPEILQAGKSLRDLDLLIVPINGNYGVMNTLDAALLTRALVPRHVIPCHFGMFPNNTNDPYKFVSYVRGYNVPTRPLVLSVGGGCLIDGGA